MARARTLIAQVTLHGRHVLVSKGEHRSLRLCGAQMIGEGMVVDRDCHAPDVDAEVEDSGLVKIIDAVDDITMTVLPCCERLAGGERGG